MGRDIEWEAEQYRLGRCAQCASAPVVAQPESEHYYCEEGTDEDPTPVHRCNQNKRSPVVPQPAAEKRLFEAKLLGFGEADRIRLCAACLERAIGDDFVIFSCGLPLDAPTTVCTRCGGSGEDPEHEGKCGECAAAVPQHCNFCGESKPDLIPATSGFICKDCVAVCASMVEKPVAPVLPDERRQYRTTTEGSKKWDEGHQVKCVFYAPDNACICSLLPVPEDEEENQNQKVKDA